MPVVCALAGASPTAARPHEITCVGMEVDESCGRSCQGVRFARTTRDCATLSLWACDSRAPAALRDPCVRDAQAGKWVTGTPTIGCPADRKAYVRTSTGTGAFGLVDRTVQSGGVE